MNSWLWLKAGCGQPLHVEAGSSSVLAEFSLSAFLRVHFAFMRKNYNFQWALLDIWLRPRASGDVNAETPPVGHSTVGGMVMIHCMLEIPRRSARFAFSQQKLGIRRLYSHVRYRSNRQRNKVCTDIREKR